MVHNAKKQKLSIGSTSHLRQPFPQFRKKLLSLDRLPGPDTFFLKQKTDFELLHAVISTELPPSPFIPIF